MHESLRSVNKTCAAFGSVPAPQPASVFPRSFSAGPKRGKPVVGGLLASLCTGAASGCVPGPHRSLVALHRSLAPHRLI